MASVDGLRGCEPRGSSKRPHYLKNLGPEEGVFVRIGSTHRKADAALMQELRRMASNETFDESPLAELDSEAPDFRAASESFPVRGRLTKADLQTLRLLTSHGRRLVPTVGGLLLFGRQPGRRFPDPWIQCGRFKGINKAELTDTMECRGMLSKSLEAAYEFIKRHAMQGVAINGLKHVERTGIPLRAARELLVNAVVHADYAQQGAPIRVSLFDDRIEIENPGVLLAGLTIDDIRQGISRLRNRVIGRIFKELGYIEQWGAASSGLQPTVRQPACPHPNSRSAVFVFVSRCSWRNAGRRNWTGLTHSFGSCSRQALRQPRTGCPRPGSLQASN